MWIQISYTPVYKGGKCVGGMGVIGCSVRELHKEKVVDLRKCEM